ncbi:MAG TPA: hypothetical protein VIS09_17310, partial [Streptomyces sp.]
MDPKAAAAAAVAAIAHRSLYLVRLIAPPGCGVTHGFYWSVRARGIHVTRQLLNFFRRLNLMNDEDEFRIEH